MRDITKWQIVSFISRGMAMAFGLVQSFVILRILTQAQWGIVQLAISIGGALGIYQQLGLASASTREISSAKNDTQIFKIFVTSVFIRYIVTFPLAFGLFFFSDHIALNVYHHPEISFPLKIYAVTLLFQGFQSILNSVISGTMRFKNLFTYQVVIAFVSILIFIPLVYVYKINGYFYAFLIFNILSTSALSIIAFAPLRNKLVFPSWGDFKVLLKEIFSISIAIYFMKIIYTNWEKFGSNVIGLFSSAETIAIYGFALLFAKKIMNISDAVTDVNLPVLSEKFVNNIKDFKETFSDNFSKVFSLIIISAVGVTYWAPQIIYVLAGSKKYFEYFDSLHLIPPLILAFILYSIINIVTASIFIPAKLAREMTVSFVFLIAFTALSFVGSRGFLGDLTSMAWAMACGAFFSFWYMGFSIKKNLKFVFFSVNHYSLLIQGIIICFVGELNILWLKSLVFVPLMFLLLWNIISSKFVTKEDFVLAKDKFLSKFGLHK